MYLLHKLNFSIAFSPALLSFKHYVAFTPKYCMVFNSFCKTLKTHTQYREIVCFVFRYKCIYLKKNLFFGLLSFCQWLQVTIVFVCQPICGCYCPCNMWFRLVTQLYMVVWVTVQKWGKSGGTKTKKNRHFIWLDTNQKRFALVSCSLNFSHL